MRSPSKPLATWSTTDKDGSGFVDVEDLTQLALQVNCTKIKIFQ